MPAAVTACLKTLSLTSPAAKTPGILVTVESGFVIIYPSLSISNCPLNKDVAGSCPIATNKPWILISVILLVFNYEFWEKKGFNFIKKSWISNVYKVNNKIIVKYKNNCIKGKIVDLLINGGIKLKTRKETKEIFYGDQITWMLIIFL